MLARLKTLAHDNSGASAVEFALIGPTFLGIFLGVLHFGVGMQNYNALRAVSADVARYAVVNYQTNNRLTTAQLQSYARSVATSAPYSLASSRFSARISSASTQRVSGATEYSLSLSYSVPTYLGILGMDSIALYYSRPIFVLTTT